MADVNLENLTKAAKDALYVGVGAGVLVFQKAQVQRRELQRQFSGQVDEAKDQLGTVAEKVEDRIKVVEERLESVEERFESLLDQVEENVPEQAREVFKQARKAAKDARGQVRQLVNRAA
jgi:prefoldin subunit 5